MSKKQGLINSKWFYVALGSVMMLLLISHSYNDILVTTRHGISFWQILFDGNFFDFYNLNVTASGNAVYDTAQGCAYHILIYIVFAVWNFPLYLIELFTGIEPMNNIFCIIWAKLLVATAFFVSAYLLMKILKELNISDKMQQVAKMLYLSSAMMLAIIFITGGYDVLGLCFMMLGFLAYLKKQHKWFLFWFSLAICFKYLALVALVPLLLLRQKKVFLLLRDGLLSLSFYVVTTIPFMLAGAERGGLEESLFGVVFASESALIHWFLLAYGAICIIAYMTESDDSAYTNEMAIWLSFAAYASFFGLCTIKGYWIVILIPFMVLLIANNARFYRINILLETVGTVAILGYHYFYRANCFFGDTLNSMLWKYLTPDLLNQNDGRIQYVLARCAFYYPMLRSAFILACLALAYFNFPKKEQMQKLTEFTVEYDVFILRWVGVLGFVLIPILVMLSAAIF